MLLMYLASKGDQGSREMKATEEGGKQDGTGKNTRRKHKKKTEEEVKEVGRVAGKRKKKHKSMRKYPKKRGNGVTCAPSQL